MTEDKTIFSITHNNDNKFKANISIQGFTNNDMLNFLDFMALSFINMVNITRENIEGGEEDA